MLPPLRWSLVWRIPVAILLAAGAMLCFAVDDLIKALRRLLR